MKTVTVIGAGPAGASVAIYLLRAGISTTVIYKDMGALGKAHAIDNYYGLEPPISGSELFERGLAQIRRLGANVVQDEVVGLAYGEKFDVQTTRETFPSDIVVLATGTSRVTPKIEGLKAYEGRGVSHCAVCDAFFYRGRHVAVLGSGEYALHEASVLLPMSASVTLFTQGKEPPEALPENLRVDRRKIVRLSGGESLESLTLEGDATVQVDGLFVAVGVAGSADLARKIGAEVSGVHIVTDSDKLTTVEGIYACGD